MPLGLLASFRQADGAWTEPVAVPLAGVDATPEEIEFVRVKYGLDRPIVVQYADWARRAFEGDFGISPYFKQPVQNIIGGRLGVTMTLGACALAFAIWVAVTGETRIVQDFDVPVEALWARFGYTTGQEGRTTPGAAEVIRAVADEGGLPIDIVAYSDVLAPRDYIVNNVTRDYRNRYRLGGAKLTIDGITICKRRFQLFECVYHMPRQE